MDDFVPDSDDEQQCFMAGPTGRNAGQGTVNDLDAIYSDPEDDWDYSQRVQSLHVQPSVPQNVLVDQQQLGQKFKRRPLPKSKAPPKRLISSAAAAAKAARQAASQTINIDPPTVVDHPQLNPSSAAPSGAGTGTIPSLVPPLRSWNSFESMSQQGQQPSCPPAKRFARTSFIGRASSVDPATRIIPAAIADGGADLPQPDVSTHRSNSESVAIGSMEPKPMQSERAPETVASTAPMKPLDVSQGTGAIVHRNDDGLNVVVLRKDPLSNPDLAQTKQGRSVNTGWGNNFVRIDLKKGHGSTKFQANKYSRKRKAGGSFRGRGRGWKTPRLRQVGDGSEFLDGWSNRQTTCYRCGGTGHWAKDCTGTDTVADLDGDEALSEDDDVVTLSSTRHAAAGSAPSNRNASMEAQQLVQRPINEPLSEEYASIAANPSQESLEGILQEVFGFQSLRGLQYETISRVLQGGTCLSIMPTGMGKSLCYQLPALLSDGLTLVVSPLIALMKDQCASAPPCLPVAMLWSEQSQQEAKQVLADVERGLIRLLFVSPERLANPHLLDALRPRMPLPLVVVDEAHCVAEWGHSFRPAYFRLGGVLQREVSARSILALTATATKDTEEAVCAVLGIPQRDVLRDAAVNSNLRLNVARKGPGESRQRWRHIVELIKDGDLADVKSIIVYCAWKSDAETIAKQLAASGIAAKPYHAGRDTKERGLVEQAFAAGRIRVVVATVAFGMGINLHSVKGIVHAVIPRSLEEYVQQVGRAGRDGSEGKCYAFVDDSDFIALRSLMSSGVVEEGSILKLLNLLFRIDVEDQLKAPKGKTAKAAAPQQMPTSTANPLNTTRRYGVLPIKKLAAELDVQEENIESTLSFLEAQSPSLIRVLPKIASVAKVSFYAAAPEALVEEYPIVQAVLDACRNPRNGVYSVCTAKLGVAAGKVPGVALQALQALAAQRLIGFSLAGERGLAYEVLQVPDDIDALATIVSTRLSKMLRCQVSRLDTAYRAFAAGAAVESQPERQENVLRKAIKDYFEAPLDAVSSSSNISLDNLPLRPASSALLTACQAVLRRNQDQAGQDLTPSAIARILHGVGSSGFPRDQWSKRMASFWGSLKTTDFQLVLNAARMAFRSSDR